VGLRCFLIGAPRAFTTSLLAISRMKIQPNITLNTPAR
jgi:hypothetical protein